MKLEYVSLPKNFVTLLKVDFWPGHPSYRNSVQYVLKQNDLFRRYKTYWPTELAFNDLFASLGWPLFREKISYTFLNEHNSKINTFNYQDFITQYNLLEKKFDNVMTSGHSRLFLLNFYLLSLGNDPFKVIDYKFILKYFSKLAKRVTRIDWLILFAHFFSNHYEEETLYYILEDEFGYEFLIDNLEDEDLKRFNEMVYHYSSSIGDSSFFANISKDFV